VSIGRRSHLVGWLYADLLLVLLIAALSGVATHQPDDSDVSVSASASPSPEPTKDVATLDRDPITLSVKVDSADLLAGSKRVEATFRRDFSEAFARELAARGIDQDEARIGFDLTFGYNQRLGVAQDVAEAANRQARRAERKALADAAFRGYGSTRSAEDPDHVTFELFLLR
jgi:hypothetical protein